jgi:hypothetical protein
MTDRSCGASPRPLADQALALLSEAADAELLRAPASAPRALDPEVLVRRARERVRPELYPEAERELLAIHREEQAALLADAAELAMAARPQGLLLVAPRPVDLADWRRRCAAEVGLALEGGVEVDGDLLACSVLGAGAWPGPAELAAAAARLAPGAAAELRLGRALAAEGRHAEGRRCLSALDGSLLPLAAQLESLRLRADLDHARGAFGGALRRLRRVLALGRGVESALALLALAEELDREPERELASERLADSGASRGAARRALAALEERRLVLGRPLAAPVRGRLLRELEPRASQTSTRRRP